ncbi:S41 family peptidase [Pedobacter sp. KR3-3]|uniref:S41 family peptidase n=1 Tax=Pedobacter albus TaxID=3113905 RepID=A0ABU7I241_9SPHI|nr:S41 family peptidase [Pedobacter sp. KR3-3]MEE1943531.1 S41 family peptidase [Pedobacter sp. KR3-3]
MKKQLLIFFTVLSLMAKAQTSSQQAKNIQKFIQVWGLIKYKSPQGIAGSFDADKVFLTNMASISQADEASCNEQLLALLKENTAGVVKPDPVADKSLYLNQNLDNRWIKAYPKNLQWALQRLIDYRNASGKHHYISTTGKNDGLVPNEAAYADYDFKNEAMNLLALAKAWAVIEYLFPYKYVIGKNWQAVLVESIPMFRAVDSRMTYEKAVLTLENAINDTHAAGILNQLKTMPQIFKLVYYPPFDYEVSQWKIVVKDMLNDSLAQVSALKKGDQILAINGISSEQWLKAHSALLPASNDAIKQRHLSTDYKGRAFAFADLPAKTLAVKVRRGNSLLNLQLEMLERRNSKQVELINTYFRAKYNAEQAWKGYEELDGQIALIRAGRFYERSLPQDEEAEITFSKQLKSKKAIIFDMREYPQAPGLFYYYLPKALGKPAFNFGRYYRSALQNPGAFVSEEAVETFMSKDIKPIGDLYSGQIIILTSQNTQSMAEWFSMMLRQFNKNTVVIGSQTAGADGDEKQLNLPGGYQFVFTGNGIFYPNGKETQRIGIIPDIEFKPTATEIASGTDAQLQKALNYINKIK